MKKFIYTFIFAIGIQFAQAQKLENVYLLGQAGQDIFYVDMNGYKFENLLSTTQSYSFTVDISFSNTLGETLHPKDSLDENQNLLYEADSIRVEVYVNGVARFPVISGADINPNGGYINPVKNALTEDEEYAGYYWYDGYYPDADIEIGNTGFLGWVSFTMARTSLLFGENRTNEVCVKLTHWKRGDSEPILLSEELCINFQMILKGSGEDDVTESAFNTVKIHPNIVRNILKIDNISEMMDVAVYSITGQLLKNIPSAIGNIEIDISNLISGIYVVKMQNKQNILTKKFQIVK